MSDPMTSTPSPRSLSAEMREVSTLSRRDALGNCRAIATILDRWAESVAALEQENARLLANPTVRELNDLWLKEEQEAIDALRRAEAAEASLAQREAEIAQIRELGASWRERVARADREDRGATLAMSMLVRCADEIAALVK
jgi:hypothetical protein